METHDRDRLHALDNLRALLMWLGIVLHVAAIYTVNPSPLPWRDTHRTQLADVACAFIHTFRMPTFFILAGFFVMSLLQARGAKGMATHRLARLGAPFVVFWIPLTTVCGLFAALFVHRMVRSSWGVDISLVNPPPGVPRGPNTLHMWFLWMLLWFSLATAVLARFEDLRPLFAAAGVFLRRLAVRWWGCLVLALPLQMAGYAYAQGLLISSGLFLPPVAEWLHYGTFFVFGLALHAGRSELFAFFERRCWVFVVAGLATFLTTGVMLHRQSSPSDIAFVYGMAAWLWSFAAIGLALRLLPTRHRMLSYLADSSYWIYLIHFPLTIAIGLVLYGLDISPLWKIGINIALTSLMCLFSYRVWVRRTWIGELLNGRRLN